MDEKQSWSSHISKAINKMGRLTNGLKFLRKRLDEKQFLKILTSQYYGTCYYACQSWLGAHTRKKDIRKLDSMRYRLLRIAKHDYKRRMGRVKLDKAGRARPTQWGKYAPSSTVLKILRDKEPRRLHKHLKRTLNHERRNTNKIKFYEASANQGGFQAIGNRIKELFEEIEGPDNMYRIQ